MPDWTNTLASRQQGGEEGFSDVNAPVEDHEPDETTPAAVEPAARAPAGKPYPRPRPAAKKSTGAK